ncbi:MAG: DNA repair protein RecN [Desulfobacteraceae bacterium]
MLSELAIKNFAIIDDIRISFKEDLAVLTGETGAGKSIIIEAVNLLLGSRASADLIRAGYETAELEACFEINPESEQSEVMREQDIDPAEGLMVRRVISTSGKHKIFINSRQSSIQLLKRITNGLAGISSQHAHQGLLREENHLDILDRFCGILDEKEKTARIYNELTPLVKELEQVKENRENAKEEAELLRHQIEEIRAAGIKKNEDLELEQEKDRLKNASGIYETVQKAIGDLYTTDGSVVEQLDTFHKGLEKFGRYDPALSGKAEKVAGVMYEIEDLVGDLRTYIGNLTLDPAALEETEARLDLIQKLKRKYGGSLESLFSEYESMQQRYAATSGLDEKIDALTERIKELKNQYTETALAMSEKRKKGAEELSMLVKTELQSLEMEQADFRVQVKQADADPEKELFTVDGLKASPTGIDKAAFLISPNPGEPAKALKKIASGGELSRIVLALKVILSRSQAIETLIFDEVDAGIGGATSEKVGAKLKNLASDNQVICITHLAQIAKYGKEHYKIEKRVSGQSTSTVIRRLETDEDRVEELARMIGGSEITKATLHHAEEMLQTASG